MKRTLFCAVTLTLACATSVATARAGEANFNFKVAHRDVAADLDGIWGATAFSAGKASVYEYELATPSGDLLVSQLWNGDCSASTCPTRLVRLEPGGRRVLLADDMMRQIIPPNDPRYAGLPKTGPQASFAEHPFRLSADGTTLINGDLRFSSRGGKR